jgi:hypothetical protein
MATSVDRRYGVNGNLAFKAPVRLATTANITLSGLQSIDGVTTAADDRVLVKNQTTASENGIYDASSSSWTRSVDANGNRDLVEGTSVFITDGSTLAGTYWYITTANPITVGTSSISWSRSLASELSTLSFLQAGTGGVLRGAQDKMRESVSAFDFMTAAQIADVQARTLLVDVTAACQAAIDTDHSVFFPAGSYRISSALATGGNQTIFGESMLATVISQVTAGQNGFTVNAAAGTVIRDLRITCSAVSTADGISVTSSNPCYIQDVRIDAMFRGIVNNSSNNLFITRAYCVDNISIGVDLIACVDCYMDTVYASGHTNSGNGVGIRAQGACSGIYMTTMQVAANDTNFKTCFLQPANVAGIPGQIFIEKMISDSAVVNGINMEQGNTIRFANSWSSNRGTGSNWLIGAAVTDTLLDGCKTFNNTGHGVEIRGTNTVISGGSFQDASDGAANTYDNIHVTGSSANGTVITGVRCYSDGSTARYGIRVTSGALNTTIKGCDLRGNVTGGYLDDAGASTYNRMEDPQFGVTASIPNGNTVTLFTLPAGPGNYLVFAGQDGGVSGGIRAMAYTRAGTSSCGLTSIVAVGGATLSSTGANLEVQLANSSGGALVADWSYVRM